MENAINRKSSTQKKKLTWNYKQKKLYVEYFIYMCQRSFIVLCGPLQNKTGNRSKQVIKEWQLLTICWWYINVYVNI